VESRLPKNRPGRLLHLRAYRIAWPNFQLTSLPLGPDRRGRRRLDLPSPDTPGDVLWPLADHLGTVRDLAEYALTQQAGIGSR